MVLCSVRHSSWNQNPFPSLQKTKRKLDEAAQRLECLYEKLCEETVSTGSGAPLPPALPPSPMARGCPVSLPMGLTDPGFLTEYRHLAWTGL